MSSFSLNNLKLIFFRNYQWSSKLDTIILTSSIATGTKATNTMAASTMATKGPEFLGGSFCWVNFDHYPSQENDHYIILDSRDPASIGDGLGNSWFVNFNMLAQWLSTEALPSLDHVFTYQLRHYWCCLVNQLVTYLHHMFVCCDRWKDSSSCYSRDHVPNKLSWSNPDFAFGTTTSDSLAARVLFVHVPHVSCDIIATTNLKFKITSSNLGAEPMN